MLLVRGGWRTGTDAEEQMEARFCISKGMVEVLRRRLLGGREDIREAGRDEVSLAEQLGDEARRGRSMTEGFPEKTTDTIRAVSSWLPRRMADF